MADEELDAPEPDVLELFDTHSGTGPGLVCRVCGSLVADSGDYPQAHWAWHEAPNGA